MFRESEVTDLLAEMENIRETSLPSAMSSHCGEQKVVWSCGVER